MPTPASRRQSTAASPTLSAKFPFVGTVNTRYIYTVSSRLVNVRLDADRLRKARRLRARGITLSDVVREAIDREYEAVESASAPTDVPALARRIFEDHPDPPDLPPREYDVHDAKAARVAIRRRLGRRARS